MDNQEAFDQPVYGYPRSKWPVIWGIVSIVFGVFGLLFHGMQAVQLLFISVIGGDMYSAMPTGTTGDPNHDKIMEAMMDSQAQMMEAIKEAAPLSIVSGIVLALVAILLLVGGIILCMRKQAAAKTLKIWAVAKIGASIFAAGASYKLMNATLGSYNQMISDLSISTSSGSAPPPPMPDMSGAFGALSVIFVVLGFAWGIALPVFYLIWFNRESVIEDMKNGPGW